MSALPAMGTTAVDIYNPLSYLYYAPLRPDSRARLCWKFALEGPLLESGGKQRFGTVERCKDFARLLL